MIIILVLAAILGLALIIDTAMQVVEQKESNKLFKAMQEEARISLMASDPK